MLLSHQLVMTDAQTHRIADIQQQLGIRFELQAVAAWVTDESLYSYPWDVMQEYAICMIVGHHMSMLLKPAITAAHDEAGKRYVICKYCSQFCNVTNVPAECSFWM